MLQRKKPGVAGRSAGCNGPGRGVGSSAVHLCPRAVQQRAQQHCPAAAGQIKASEDAAQRCAGAPPGPRRQCGCTRTALQLVNRPRVSAQLISSRIALLRCR